MQWNTFSAHPVAFDRPQRASHLFSAIIDYVNIQSSAWNLATINQLSIYSINWNTTTVSAVFTRVGLIRAARVRLIRMKTANTKNSVYYNICLLYQGNFYFWLSRMYLWQEVTCFIKATSLWCLSWCLVSDSHSMACTMIIYPVKQQDNKEYFLHNWISLSDFGAHYSS